MSDQSAHQNGPLDFFKAQWRAFTETLAERKERADLLDGLLNRAYSSFEVNAGIQSAGQPALACYKGCSTCCTLRVTATAPEVLMIARFVRGTEPMLRHRGINLVKRIARTDSVTRGLSERQRVVLKRQCPFLVSGCCIIYPAGPLACRGHASFDKQACQEAAAGNLCDIPCSMPHMTVRGLIQNALQSALRDAGLAWASYELNHSVCLALAKQRLQEAWQSGHDVFREAQTAEVDLREIGESYDAVKSVVQ